MKTSPLVLLALVGSASAQATPADQLATQIVGLEKALEWSGELALGSVEKVIEIRKFLKDLTQLMAVVTYSNDEYQQAVVDFGRILNQYYDIASKT